MKRITILFFCFFLLQRTNAFVAGDTVNVTDNNNAKQGYWVIKNTDKKQPGFKEDQVVEEGFYKDGRKQGVWKAYHPNGKTKSEITYLNNRPFGYAKFYYSNGILQEEGIWENNRWTGAYKCYYENGKPIYDWKFNSAGKRDGVQKYFYFNGNLMIIGEWKEGKENGIQKEYYENGAIKSEKNYTDGNLDVASVKNYEPVKVVKEEEIKITEEQKALETPPAKENLDFISDGYHKIFNKNLRVEKEGEFKNSVLWDGKVYEYRGDNVVKTIIIKNGKTIEVINSPDK